MGANLAVRFKQAFQDLDVVALDNLRRRGSELNLGRLRSHGVNFIHGDIRNLEDFSGIKEFDLLIDCAAEPSVHAGVKDSTLSLLENNLTGSIHCLEATRNMGAAILFLSSSRVYPIKSINRLPYRELETRYDWDILAPGKRLHGFSDQGITEKFPLEGTRSLYGASKLSVELLLQEYVDQFKLPGLINRCGILSGPWQMGRVDQGVVALWVAHHVLGRQLSYIGYQGTGKQVRDILHVDDLFDLLILQCQKNELWDGRVYNIGGGRKMSVSLRELTELCWQATGRKINISEVHETNPLDFRIYITDSGLASKDFCWQPERDCLCIVEEIRNWVENNRSQLESIFC